MDIKVGDAVDRFVGNPPKHFMSLTVTKIEGSIIYCGDWTFDKETGAEIDEYLQWGPLYGRTGSFIKATLQEER